MATPREEIARQLPEILRLVRWPAATGQNEILYVERRPGEAGDEVDELRIYDDDKASRLVFVRARPGAEPVTLELAYRTGKHVPKLEDMTRRVFTKAFREERTPKDGVPTFTFSVTAGKITLEKTFYEALPIDLAPVAQQLRGLVAETQKK
jgi:hypothetical protein